MAKASLGKKTRKEPMKTKMQLRQTEAKQGEKMIEVRVRFWTNKIAPEENKVIPKHAWTAGVVRIDGNKSHNITPGSWKPFHSLLDIGAAIEKVLIEEGIVLHLDPKMGKYIKEDTPWANRHANRATSRRPSRS